MMKYKALVSFSGVISMAEGEVREIEDPAIVNDLLKAGYIQAQPGGTPTKSGGTPTADHQEVIDGQPPSEAGVPVQRSAGAKKKGGKKKSEN